MKTTTQKRLEPFFPPISQRFGGRSLSATDLHFFSPSFDDGAQPCLHFATRLCATKHRHFHHRRSSQWQEESSSPHATLSLRIIRCPAHAAFFSGWFVWSQGNKEVALFIRFVPLHSQKEKTRSLCALHHQFVLHLDLIPIRRKEKAETRKNKSN